MRPTVQELATALSPDRMRMFGQVRRMLVTFVGNALWQLTGFRFPDGTSETLDVEHFPGIGYYAVPNGSGVPEAIAVLAGGAKSPAIVALRDEKTRASVVNQATGGNGMAAGEVLVFSPQAVAYFKADGTIEIRAAGGAASALVPLAQLQALAQAFSTWVPVPNDGGAALKTLLTGLISGPPAWPAGTIILKGQ